jgi:hypothetical protein
MFGSFFLLPFMPWYIPFLIGAFASWYYILYEFILLGFFMDIMFASGHFVQLSTFHAPLFFTFLSALLIILLQTIKNKVRFYA